jgi:hypothetical protein
MTGDEAKERARRIVVVEDVDIFTRTLYGGPHFSNECPACGERTNDAAVCTQCGRFIRDAWDDEEKERGHGPR